MQSFAAVHDTNTFRSAILFTFRGNCSELFVFGKCSKNNSTCTFDHSAAGQEKCIQSFSLLSNCLLMVSYHYRSYTIRTQTSENPPTTKAAFLSQEVDRLFNLDHMAAAIPATLEITTLRKTTSKATTNRD